MALRFRKSIRIAPGIRLNLGKRTVSTTIGPRGLSFNVSRRGTYINAGIPGTGISSRTKLTSAADHSELTSLAREAGTDDLVSPAHKPHWRFTTILLFFVTMIGAGLTKNPAAIDLFWLGWICYWLYCAIRKAVIKPRNSNLV